MCTFRFDDQFTFCLNFLLFASFPWVPQQINLFIAYFFTLSSVNGLGIVFGQKTTFCRSVYVFSYLFAYCWFHSFFFSCYSISIKKNQFILFHFQFLFTILSARNQINCSKQNFTFTTRPRPKTWATQSTKLRASPTCSLNPKFGE